MTYANDNTLTIAITSSALFDLSHSHDVYEKKGVEAYSQYQQENEKIPLKPGRAFPFVHKVLQLNRNQHFVEVILLSRNSSDTGMRVFESIRHYDLPIKRAAFTSGESPYLYANAFAADLFLSTNPNDVSAALESGCAAATILPSHEDQIDAHSDQLRIAFDGDAVLFDPESELIFQQDGIEAFYDNEKHLADKAMQCGPFKQFLSALHNIQKQFTADDCPIRTALFTARSAPAHERVIKTLREWGIRIDECLFLGGQNKTEFLCAFKADIFFDDQLSHCESSRHRIATGHVPSITTQ